jgi:thioredoxin-like negative regulator of GroEL
MELTVDQAFQRGVAAHKQGKLRNAERFYRAVLQIQPKHPDANHNLGVLAVSVGKIEEALPLLKQALDLNPEKEQFWLSYLDGLIRAGKVDAATRVLADGTAKTYVAPTTPHQAQPNLYILG